MHLDGAQLNPYPSALQKFCVCVFFWCCCVYNTLPSGSTLVRTLVKTTSFFLTKLNIQWDFLCHSRFKRTRTKGDTR